VRDGSGLWRVAFPERCAWGTLTRSKVRTRSALREAPNVRYKSARVNGPTMLLRKAIQGQEATNESSQSSNGTRCRRNAERLQSLKMPTLIIHGTGDLAIAFDGGEKRAELIPHARLFCA
jgi:pimeloyl-ACP methyl ester carboxylesterase